MSPVIVSEESPVLGFYEFAFHALGTSCVRTYLEVIRLLPGKIPPEILQSIVFSKLGKKDPDVLLGPGLGEDAAVIRIGDQVVIASTDPITGSIEDVGWLAVHANANDIATFGVSPRWFLVTVLLPSDHAKESLEKVMEQINTAAYELGIAIAGGHSEITESITHPIVVGFMMGTAPGGGYVTSSGAKPDDTLILTKTVGIEGTSILATEGSSYLEKILEKNLIREGQKLRNSISVVKEGVSAFQTGFVHAMHDPTEGGLANGIHEMCDASGVGCEIDGDLIPLHQATRKICEYLRINPLELISSGCMMISCDSKHTDMVIQTLTQDNIPSVAIGTFHKNPTHRKIRIDGKTKDLTRPKTDALWGALKKVNPS